MSFHDDLLAEGEPEQEFHQGIAARLPRKRVAAGALFRDAANRVLAVEPTYKPTWDIPGGIVNANESPLAACNREVHEELGVSPPIGDLLVVDWVPSHGVWGDGLMFIFDGGLLDNETCAQIRLQASEISSWKFATLDEIAARTRPSMTRRLRLAVDAATTKLPRYADFGRLPDLPLS